MKKTDPPPKKKRRRRKETSADSPDTIKDQYCSKTAVCYVFIVTVKIYYMILDFLFGARTIMTLHWFEESFFPVIYGLKRNYVEN